MARGVMGAAAAVLSVLGIATLLFGQGTVSSNLQDLAVAVVDVPPPAGTRPAVVGLGAALVACAAGLLLASARPRARI